MLCEDHTSLWWLISWLWLITVVMFLRSFIKRDSIRSLFCRGGSCNCAELTSSLQVVSMTQCQTSLIVLSEVSMGFGALIFQGSTVRWSSCCRAVIHIPPFTSFSHFLEVIELLNTVGWKVTISFLFWGNEPVYCGSIPFKLLFSFSWIAFVSTCNGSSHQGSQSLAYELLL